MVGSFVLRKRQVCALALASAFALAFQGCDRPASTVGQAVSEPERSPSAPSSGKTSAASFVYMVIETENAEAIEPPMVRGRAPDSECSGGEYIEIPVQEPRGADKVNGRAVVPFEITTPGAYFLHARCWWYDGCGNSFRVAINDGPNSILTSSTEQRWHWVKLGGEPFLLLAGQHILIISNSEDGARLDQVVLTNDPDYVPQGIEGP